MDQGQKIQQHQENQKKSFTQQGLGPFLQNLALNFGHRYLEDPQGGPSEVIPKEEGLVSAQAPTPSLKNLNSVLTASLSPQFREEYRQGMKNGRPLVIQGFKLDARGLDGDGKGKFKVTFFWEWNFTGNSPQSFSLEKIYSSVSFEELRKKFPVQLDEWCEEILNQGA